MLSTAASDPPTSDSARMPKQMESPPQPRPERPERRPDSQPNPSEESDPGRPSPTSTNQASSTDPLEPQKTNPPDFWSRFVPEMFVRHSVYENAVRDLSSMQEDLRKAKETASRLIKELENERSRSSAVTRDLHISRDLAESRRQELKVLENYLTTADKAAGSDVKSSVEMLNSIIKHETANMVEGLTRRNVRAEYQDVRQYLCIDIQLVNVLRSDLGEDESFIIRTALQATLVIWVGDLVSAWCLTSTSADRKFAQTYQRIYQSEDQSIAGKWRSLSRAQMPKDNTELQAKFIRSISKALRAVFIVAGFDREESRNRISGFAEGIGRIVRAALELNQLIGEQITSADFKVDTVQPGTSFDHGSMKDIECPRQPQTGRVLCTSALGLCRREGKPKPTHEIVMKPEVLVDCILKDLRTGRK